MEDGMRTLKKMGTWILKDLPKGRQTVGSKWVFNKKQYENGNVHYKAWLVAQRFTQKPGMDYSNNGTFAPVMQFESLCTLLALMAVKNQKLQQFDIKGVYLHGVLHEVIFMEQPESFNNKSAYFCKLI